MTSNRASDLFQSGPSLTNALKRLIVKLANRRGYDFVRLVDAQAVKPIKLLELIVADYLRRSGRNALRFVQIGANDGVELDPIWNMVQSYWRGVLVEPNPVAFARLRQNYRHYDGIQLEMAAITATDGAVTLYCPVGTAFESLHASTDRAAVIMSQKMVSKRDVVEMREVQCPSLTLPSLFKKYAIEKLDLMVIDTEGHDYCIIQQLLKMTQMLPNILQYEHAFMSKEQQMECMARLSQAGYRVLPCAGDTVAVTEAMAA